MSVLSARDILEWKGDPKAEAEEEAIYRRGYWDGVYQAREYLRDGATPRQVDSWLWTKLFQWEHSFGDGVVHPPIMFKFLTRRRRPHTPGGMAVARDGYGPSWRTQRKKALDRDGYACQKCGKKADPLKWWKKVHVHHKRKIRLHYDDRTRKIDYEEANRLSNLETLCKRCHKAADGYGKSRGFVRLR